MSVWRDSRVLITGGAGFIGSVLVSELNLRGCRNVVIVDSASQNRQWRNLENLYFESYLEPYAALSGLHNGKLGHFDFIFHLGACSSTTERDETYLYRNNYVFSRDLACWALYHGVRFVYASSAATYGAGPEMSDTADLNSLRPLNDYGASKHMMDVYAQRCGWLDDIVALKYFNVFGPNEGHKGDMRSVVLKGYEQIKETGTMHLFKMGEHRRDFLYVKDAVAVTLYLAENPAANGIFNVGSGEAHSFNELATAVFAAMNREPRIEYIDMPENIKGQYQSFTQANISKLRAVGYTTPATSLRAAVRDYVGNYLIPNKPLGAVTNWAVSVA